MYNEMRDDERRRKRNTAVIAVVVTVCILVLAAIGRRMPDDFFQRWVQENFSEQHTAQTTEPPSEKLVFDIFTYYNPYTQTGLTQDEVIALHGEPQSVVQDPEGYTGAVEWQYADRVLRFWEGEVYYLQMRNTSWAYESTDDFSEMFHLLETEKTSVSDNSFYRVVLCGADKVCIGYDEILEVITYLSVFYFIPEKWLYDGFYGYPMLLNPPLLFDFSKLYVSESGGGMSYEEIMRQYGEPSSIVDYGEGRMMLHYDSMSFHILDYRLYDLVTYDVAWQYESIDEILPMFGLQNTEQTETRIEDDFFVSEYCGIRRMQGNLDFDEKIISELFFNTQKSLF